MQQRARLHRSICATTLLSLAIPGLTWGPIHASSWSPALRHHATKVVRRTCVKRNKATGTLRLSIGTLPTSLNPTGDLNGFPILENLIFESLDLYNPSFHLVPRLLSRIPTLQNGDIRDGGKTTLLRLKHGLQWSNGMEITSADVRFGWLTMKAGGQCYGLCRYIRKIDTPDRYTAVWRLTAPRPISACPCLQPPVFPHMWPGYWKDNPKRAAQRIYQDPSFTYLGRQFPTDGPYQVTAYVPHREIVFQPMKHYHVMSCGARINKIVAVESPSQPAALAAAAARKVDVTWGWDARFVPELRRHAADFTTHVVPGGGAELVVFNHDRLYRGRPNPLSSPTVRAALSLALDRVRLVQVAYGLDQDTAQSLVAWSFWVNTPSYNIKQRYTDPTITGQWDPIAKRYRPDTGSVQALTDARQLLGKTRWKDGFSLDLVTAPVGCSYPSSCLPQRTLREMAREWSRLGVRMRVTSVSEARLFGLWNDGGLLRHGVFQAFTWDDSSGDPYEFQVAFDPKTIERDQTDHTQLRCCNFGGIRDPVLARAFTQAASPSRDRVRRDAYHLIQRRTNHRADFAPLYYIVNIATTDARGRSVQFGPNIGPGFQDELLWNPHAWTVGNG